MAGLQRKKMTARTRTRLFGASGGDFTRKGWAQPERVGKEEDE
jgi:hypothetical protein